MKAVLAYITTKDKAEAVKIGKQLVNERLAACVNILPQMESLFVWNGRLEKAKEAVLIAKTLPAKKKSLLKKVKELHSYSCPAILFLEFSDGNPEYLKWLASSVD